jgi:hypothetical protein
MNRVQVASLAIIGVATLLLAQPARVSAAEQEGAMKCGERANPVDKKKEHRIQTEGICVSGGDNHSAWWLDGCLDNHTSSSC